jgi:iron(III) transport system substrate-binding protein
MRHNPAACRGSNEGGSAVKIASKARVGSVFVLGAVAALLAATSADSRTGAAAAKPKPKYSLAALIKKSKTESGLVVYGNPPGANFNAFVERFNKKYPWIKVTESDLEDTTIFSKYASEAAQGARTADILIASAPNMWVYANRQHYVQDFAPSGITKFPKYAKQFKGIYIMSPDPAIIVYNKLLLKDKVPSSVTAMANDESTYNKVTGYSVDNLFGYTALYGYVQLKGWSAFGKIGKSRYVSSGNVAAQLQVVAQGGAKAAYLTSPTARFRIASDSRLGQILDWSYAKDGTPLVPRGIGITRKATSPASAKLFLDYIFSKVGQQAICDAGFTSFMNGFKPSGGCTNTLADVYAKVGKKNVFNPGFTQKFVNARPPFTRRWHSIFG